jgi:hypothetical protein
MIPTAFTLFVACPHYHLPVLQMINRVTLTFPTKQAGLKRNDVRTDALHFSSAWGQMSNATFI